MPKAGVLDGIRVVEFAQNAAIPQCGRLLAGLGADVVKIEPPGGDAMRQLASLSPTESKAYARVTGVDRPEIKDTTDLSFAAIVAQAGALFLTRTSAEWLAALRAEGYPCGPYNMPHQAMTDPHAEANDYVVELDHPSFGAYKTVGMPFQMEKSASRVRGPSPAFAAHTTEVMAEIGLGHELVQQLRDTGAIIGA